MPLSPLVLACFILGCGGKGGETALVRGSVKLDGVPLADAQIQFIPKANPDLGTAQAKTDVNGAFTIRPDDHNNNRLRPGEFIVLVSKIVQTDPNGGMGTPTVNKVPDKYGIQAETPLTASLVAGDNTPTFELTTQKK